MVKIKKNHLQIACTEVIQGAREENRKERGRKRRKGETLDSAQAERIKKFSIRMVSHLVIVLLLLFLLKSAWMAFEPCQVSTRYM